MENKALRALETNYAVFKDEANSLIDQSHVTSAERLCLRDWRISGKVPIIFPSFSFFKYLQLLALWLSLLWIPRDIINQKCCFVDLIQRRISTSRYSIRKRMAEMAVSDTRKESKKQSFAGRDFREKQFVIMFNPKCVEYMCLFLLIFNDISNLIN